MQVLENRIVLKSAHATAEIILKGGIIRKPGFRLPNGQWVQPFNDAPWSGDELHEGYEILPPFLRWLGGSFFCLPFGGKPMPAGVDSAWQHMPKGADELLHGYSSNATWRLHEALPNQVTLRIDYPVESPISHVDQTITCLNDLPAIGSQLLITPRRDVCISAAIHPVLRLPDADLDGKFTLRAQFETGYTYPVTTSESATAGNTVFLDLASIVSRTGSNISFERLPHGESSEDLLLLCRCMPPVIADFERDRFSAYVDWDRNALPNCMLWYSDRSLREWPFNGRFRGLGIEPCASAFDFSDATSTAPNPLRKGGETTSLQLHASEPTSLWYRIGVMPEKAQSI